ncbi:MAG: MFS transporter [Ideonella sp.]|nr:MFS transporter [Ideonella sp.]MCC7457775.1 MFS transporter [Nitrospira sp.]
MQLTGVRIAVLFGAFAFNYFLAALLRAVVATLAPEFARELQLSAADLGLLAGVYFLGFASMQLPLGSALDRHGERRVLLVLLVFGVLGCLGFALARSFGQLVVARLMIGIGLSASLIAPMAVFVRWLPGPLQLRLNSWLLMSGSLGMVASTLPVQALLPSLGWRGLFVVVAAALVVGMAAVTLATPAQRLQHVDSEVPLGLRALLSNPAFLRALPLAFFTYGGLIAVQALWAGPWLTQVVGLDATGSARGLFLINLSMLCSFLCWGLAMPRLLRHGWPPARLIAWGWPVGALLLAAIVALGPRAGAGWLAAWCACTSVVALSQPAMAEAFAKAQAGRALTAFNLVIFLGVFACQWGVGLAIDALVASGWSRASGHRAAWALLLAGMAAAGVWFWLQPGRDRRDAAVVARG